MDDIKTALEIAAYIIGSIIWTFGIIWKAQNYVAKQIAAYHKTEEEKREARAALYDQSFKSHKGEVDRFINKMMDFEDQVDEAEKKYIEEITAIKKDIEFLQRDGG